MATRKTEDTKPIVTCTNRTLRIEGDGWFFEAKVLASGKQISIKADGLVDGASDLLLRPGTANMVFVSSRASEQRDEENQ